MENEKRKIRIGMPTKGRLEEDSKTLLENVGFRVYNPNPRQFIASISGLPDVEVIFQRAGDIAVSVRDGSVDFGITGKDVVMERCGNNGDILELHGKLGFGHCSLNVIVPENLETVNQFSDLDELERELGRPLKIATKFPNLTTRFFNERCKSGYNIILAEGTLEIAPIVGYADILVDLVSTGTTMRDNRLKPLADGLILKSQACLIANKVKLMENPKTLEIATKLLELVTAYLRASENLSIFANMRGESPEAIADKIFAQEVIGGLQGPTISPVITRKGERWYATHLIVQKAELHQAIQEIRSIGGSGVVVAPVSYIFEEEPPEIKNMLAALER
jgi:ATP phosphoribosyltransferase